MYAASLGKLRWMPVAVLGWAFAGPAPAVAQEVDCPRSWTTSCASVQVDALGDDLIFYVPNALSPWGELPENLSESQVRVYRSAPGMTCDPETGLGCVDVTEEWLASGSPGSGLGAATSDEKREACLESDDIAEEGEDANLPLCRRGPPAAAFFVLGVPAAAVLMSGSGGTTMIVAPAPGGPGGDDGSSGGDDGSSGGDDGSGSGGDDGSGSGGDDGSGSGGDDGSGSGGDDGSSGGDDGSSGGDDGSSGGDDESSGGDDESSGGEGDYGSGGSGGDDWPGGSGHGGSHGPPVSEVPEPISTTLVGLGLLGYAGKRIRRRLVGEDDVDSD